MVSLIVLSLMYDGIGYLVVLTGKSVLFVTFTLLTFL
jgi:hypothetical protein